MSIVNVSFVKHLDVLTFLLTSILLQFYIIINRLKFVRVKIFIAGALDVDNEIKLIKNEYTELKYSSIHVAPPPPIADIADTPKTRNSLARLRLDLRKLNRFQYCRHLREVRRTLEL